MPINPPSDSFANLVAKAFTPPVVPRIQEMRYDLPPIEVPKPYVPAKHTYERLMDYITEFEKGLDDQHEVGARLVSFGSEIKFHIEDLGYWGPDIITFEGQTSNGEKVKLIQNISQLSVLLVAMKKIHPKPRRMGFSAISEAKEDEDNAGNA